MFQDSIVRNRVYRAQLCLLVLFFLAFAFSACGRLSQKTANGIFLREHPTYTLVYSATGEGWEGVGYHHFEYKKPGDENVYKEVWTFVQQDDGNWKVTSRWTPKE